MPVSVGETLKNASLSHIEERRVASRSPFERLSVYWVQPTLMVIWLVLGILFAVIHHLFYFSLNHRPVFTENRQQWPIRIGSGLTVLTISIFNMAIGAAYIQHMWTRLRKKRFSLSELNNLFALTQDISGFFSMGTFTKAKSVALLALIAWLLPIATTIPPATLAVANVVVPRVSQIFVPTLQKNVNKGWVADMTLEASIQAWTPTVWVRQIAARASIDTVIGDIPTVAPNMTYTLEFPGPALKRSIADELQQRLFDHYHANKTSMWTLASEYNSEPPSRPDYFTNLIYSGFNPHSAPEWSFSNRTNNTAAIASTGETGLQFWIQTANQSIVCLQGFSQFSAVFNWTNGSPNHRVTRLNFTTNLTDEIGWRSRVSSAVFVSLLDMVVSNVTVEPKHHKRLETEGSVMITGLRGCNEIAHNFWINKTIPMIPTLIKTVQWKNTGMSASFPTNPWLCRNKTLPAALEDLSNNITMSLIGLDLTSQNDTLADVLFFPSQLVYEYHPVNLILTYSIVGILSLIAVMFGFAALNENGIAHSLGFSAIMDSTRSPELATITNDCGLGVMPLEEQAEKTELKFGVLRGVSEGDSHRVGFILAGKDGGEDGVSNEDFVKSGVVGDDVSHLSDGD